MFKINNKNLILSVFGLLAIFAFTITLAPKETNADSGPFYCEISNFNVSSNYLAPGGSVTLNWNTNNCNSVNISNVGSVGSSGSQTVYPMNTTTYTLTAYGSNGISLYSAKTVTVQKLTCEISNFNTSSDFISSGGSVMLNWNTTNCNSVNISNLGNINNSGNQLVYPGATTTYILTAYGNNGRSITRSKTVTVQELSCSISGFNASSDRITAGDSTRLTWSTNNCNSINITNLGSVAGSGSQNVYPARTTTYTLTAYGSNGASFYQTKTVDVITPIVKNTTTTNNTTISKNTSKTTNTSSTTNKNTSKSNTNNEDNQSDTENQTIGQTSALAGNALFGANGGFMPSSLLGWLIFAILVLLAIILWRKLYVTENDKHTPLKHA